MFDHKVWQALFVVLRFVAGLVVFFLKSWEKLHPKRFLNVRYWGAGEPQFLPIQPSQRLTFANMSSALSLLGSVEGCLRKLQIGWWVIQPVKTWHWPTDHTPRLYHIAGLNGYGSTPCKRMMQELLDLEKIYVWAEKSQYFTNKRAVRQSKSRWELSETRAKWWWKECWI
jgi:hypothetical protein